MWAEQRPGGGRDASVGSQCRRPARPGGTGLDSWWDRSPCRISGGERRDELRSLMGSPAQQAPRPAQLSSQPLGQPAGGPLRMPRLAGPWPQEQERTLLPGTPRGWRRRHGAVLNSGPGESADQASLQRLLCLPGNFPQAPAVCQRAPAATTRRLPVPTWQARKGRTLGLPRAHEEARLREVKSLAPGHRQPCFLFHQPGRTFYNNPASGRLSSNSESVLLCDLG